MLSRTLRQRIGGLLREGLLGGHGGNGTASSGNSPNGWNGHGPRSNGTNGYLPGLEPTRLEPRRHFVSTGIEEILPGGLVETEHGPVFAHERLYTDLGERPVPLLRRIADLCVYPGCEVEDPELSAPRYVEVPGVDGPYPPDRLRARRRPRDLPEAVGLYDPPERGLFRRFGHRRVLYMDIETCGLSAAPVFLVGLCMVGDRNLVLRQLFARDYAEEKALLAEVRRVAAEHDFLVTFNGKAFDVPFLRDRAIHHRLAAPIEMPHLDLLWMARRRWKGILPDCKLKTIEWRVLRRRRAGDVGGSEIPGLYNDYVKRGEAHRLLPVFHHNLLDVVAMAELTPVIFDPEVTVY